MRRSLALAAAILSMPMTSHAQSGATPGTVVNGKVVVRVFVTLQDSATAFFPVTGLRLGFYRTTRDSVATTTDGSGAATIYLAPGDYRLVSAKREWKGDLYSWNVPIVVRPGMPMIDLQPPDANGSTGSRSALVGSVQRASEIPPSAPVPFTGYVARPPAGKDAATAVVFSVLITGGGQMYAGEPGKGVLLLLLGGVGAGVWYNAVLNQINCNASIYSNCSSNSNGTLAAVGLATWLGTWIYSIADAAPTAHRYNEERGLALIARPGAGKSTQLGLSLALR